MVLGASLVVLAALVAVLVVKFHVLGGGDSAAPAPTGSSTGKSPSVKTSSGTGVSPSTSATKTVTSPTATPSVKP
ncbi:MAG: hypothetical protein QOG52_2586, partial [Frankiaceae bacterium]|nr:hypothetical protein [Frankiaceae bacterium]